MALFSFLKPQKKILIVEDESAMRVLLVEKFSDAGFLVTEATDGMQAVQRASLERPDAIVLDLILPLQDGMKALDEIRRAGYKGPVVILTNLVASPELHKEAERLMATYLDKTAVSLDIVLKTVKNLL